LRDATGLDFGDRSWICNAAQNANLHAHHSLAAFVCNLMLISAGQNVDTCNIRFFIHEQISTKINEMADT